MARVRKNVWLISAVLAIAFLLAGCRTEEQMNQEILKAYPSAEIIEYNYYMGTDTSSGYALVCNHGSLMFLWIQKHADSPIRDAHAVNPDKVRCEQQ